MTRDELREAIHREMLFYYFAQREPRLEIRTDESLVSAVSSHTPTVVFLAR